MNRPGPTRRTVLAALSLAAGLGALSVAPPDARGQDKDQPKAKKGPVQKGWSEVVGAGVEYLKRAQAEDGTWSKASHPGVTAVVLTGLFRSGKVAADDPAAAKALKHVEAMVDAKDGHIAAGENIRHKFYTTSVNLQALKASGVKKYDPAAAAAVKYLKDGQVGGADNKPADDPNYGGFGYGPGARGDMSNTHFVLDALVAAGEPKDGPVFRRTLVFVGRCQNLKGEFNTLPWADKINDGSFVYLPGTGPNAAADAPRPGYGSMTYAGLKCLVWCGVSPEDPRRKKAMEWVAKNYSVDLNPGRAEGAGGQGYFYYLVSMARCLDALGVDEVTDAAGKAHDWRADITRALTLRQREDGGWGNDTRQWMEGDSNLDAGYALIALSYTKPRGK